EGLDNGTAVGATAGNYFVLHNVNVASGSLHIFADGVLGAPERGAINALQLVFDDQAPPEPPIGPLPTDVGEWWQLRGNQPLPGRSELVGGIAGRPEILWQQFVGARETLIEATYASSANSTTPLPTNDTNTNQKELDLKWGINTQYFDLDATGVLTAVT